MILTLQTEMVQLLLIHLHMFLYMLRLKKNVQKYMKIIVSKHV